MPCYVRQCIDVIAAMTDQASMPAEAAGMIADLADQAPMKSGDIRRRGKNAPATADDDDLIAAYDDLIMPDELSEEFR